MMLLRLVQWDRSFVHIWHDWEGVADAGLEGVERALMCTWGMMMADSEKGWEKRAGRKRNGQHTLVGLNCCGCAIEPFIRRL